MMKLKDRPKMVKLGVIRFDEIYNHWKLKGSANGRFCWQGIRAIGVKLDRTKKYEIRLYRVKPRGDSIPVDVIAPRGYDDWGLQRKFVRWKHPSRRRWNNFHIEALFNKIHKLFGWRLAESGVKIYFKVKEV